MVDELFLGFINENRLIEPTDRTLLAVSGGLDSMVMTHLFHQTGLPFAVAHVDFALRGGESDADAVFVQNTAVACGVPFHRVRFDTADIARQRGVSIQMAARDLRYDWFRQLLDQHGYAAVATAHHLGDVLETMLLNLTRGTGLAGLHGLAVRHDRVIRPLLFATRDDLTTYARQEQISYREDSSNVNDKYARNRIRHHVVPVLTSLNPGLWRTLPRTVERLGAAERLMQAELDRSWAETHELRDDGVWLPSAKLLALTDMTFRLTAWLKPYGFTSEQARAMADALTGAVGQRFTSPTHRITHDRISPDRVSPDRVSPDRVSPDRVSPDRVSPDRVSPDRVVRDTAITGLLLEPLPAAPPSEIVLTQWPGAPVPIGDDVTLLIDRMDRPVKFRPPTDPNYACFDADALRFPLRIRRWLPGDRFRPLGLTGTKLVSNLLNERKLTRTERERTTVLLSGDQIAWVVGCRMAHPFRVTDQTTRVVTIQRMKGQDAGW